MRTRQDSIAGLSTNYVVEFDSYTEAVNWASGSAAQRDHGISGISRGEAYHLARDGWPQGRSMVDRLLADINVTRSVTRPHIVLDVAGEGGFDAGLLLQGVPECVMDWREGEEVSQGPGPIVTIAFNVSQSGGVSHKDIEARGAAVLALVDALEAAGRRVELFAVKHNCASFQHFDYTFVVPLKHAENALQLDQITFAAVHPASNRQIGFDWVDRAGEEGLIPYADPGHGRDPETPLPFHADIYLPRLTFGHFDDPKQWVIDRLHEQGVKLEGDK